jgi:Ca2+-binding RTX toxin-like protein
MPTFRLFDDPDLLGRWFGGTITQTLATRFTYTGLDGAVVSLTGTGFTYDASGLPTGGTVTGFTLKQGGVTILGASLLSISLVSVAKFALGAASGQPWVAPDPLALKALVFGAADTFYGSTLDDDMTGGAGNDTFYGGLGDDWMAGGAGIDVLDGGAGGNGAYFHSQGALHGVTIDLQRSTGQVRDDGFGNVETLLRITHLDGSEFADRLTGNSADNKIWGDLGNDTISGLDGADTLYGGGGRDSILGGAGDDILGGGSGIDSLDGGTGVNGAFFDYDDVTQGVVVNLALASGQVLNDGYGNVETIRNFTDLEGSFRGDKLIGNAKANAFWGYGGNDSLFGGGGADSLYGGKGDDSLVGGEGDDRLGGGAGVDSIDGGIGTNTAVFDYGSETSGVTVNLALAKDQVLNDGFGNVETMRNIANLVGSARGDALTGNVGDNAIWGNEGNDTLWGGEGNDGLYGGDGQDRVFGGAGNDDLGGGQGVDYLDGGLGVNTTGYDYGTETMGAIVDLVSGQVANDGHGNAETLRNIANLVGSALGDRLTGNAGANELRGIEGDDSLVGGAGDDTLFGGAGNDTLYGGDGRDDIFAALGYDTLYGGADFDAFRFISGENTPQGQVYIADFDGDEDRIFLDPQWAGLTGGFLTASTFLAAAGATAALTAEQRVVYDTTTGWLSYDADGVGGVASVAIAQLGNLVLLDLDDLYVGY